MVKRYPQNDMHVLTSVFERFCMKLHTTYIFTIYIHVETHNVGSINSTKKFVFWYLNDVNMSNDIWGSATYYGRLLAADSCTNVECRNYTISQAFATFKLVVHYDMGIPNPYLGCILVVMRYFFHGDEILTKTYVGC